MELNFYDMLLAKTKYINDDESYKMKFLNKDLEWLEDDLEKNNLPCLIFTHFGIAEDDMKGN